MLVAMVRTQRRNHLMDKRMLDPDAPQAHMVSWGAVESGRISLARGLSLSNIYRVWDTYGTYVWAENSADCIGSCLDDMSLAPQS